MITEAELDANPWASCGPCALAALLGRPLAEIRHAFPAQREGRTWTNAAQMRAAAKALGLSWSETNYASPDTTTAHRLWPKRGLALIQFEGPWKSIATELKHSHWIATIAKDEPVGEQRAKEDLVFDANQIGIPELQEVDYWTTRAEWERVTVPMIAEDWRRATGKFWVRGGLEVRP